MKKRRNTVSCKKIAWLSEDWSKKQKLGCFLSTYTGEFIIPLYMYWGFFIPPYIEQGTNLYMGIILHNQPIMQCIKNCELANSWGTLIIHPRCLSFILGLLKEWRSKFVVGVFWCFSKGTKDLPESCWQGKPVGKYNFFKAMIFLKKKLVSKWRTLILCLTDILWIGCFQSVFNKGNHPKEQHCIHQISNKYSWDNVLWEPINYWDTKSEFEEKICKSGLLDKKVMDEVFF